MDEQETEKVNRELFLKYREELILKQSSNTVNYDNKILTLSTAFLGASIGVVFTKDSIFLNFPIDELKNSWLCFCFAIISVISSFQISNFAINKEIKIAEDMYLHKKKEKKNYWNYGTKLLNFFSGVSFITALIFIGMFVQGVVLMEQDSSNNSNQMVEAPAEKEIKNGQETGRRPPVIPDGNSKDSKGK
ncbi:MAG: hypothetical protein GY804_01620 [Alphaproteobacteria bacterium]|nr:hypothetical protein [Alphaproteobacteria bacterium]